MCKSSNRCSCSSQQNQECCLTVAININQPYECVCDPCSTLTQIETSDVVAGLLKYNSNLTKYLARYQAVPSVKMEKEDEQNGKGGQADSGGIANQAKSVVDHYNLKILSPHDHPLPKPDPQPSKQDLKQPRVIDFQTQTSPRNNQLNNRIDPRNPSKGKKQPGPVPGSNEDKIQKHMKEVALSSRYLSNTGFKKYFGRQCFQNYGRQNTTGVADGIVYNNYLKTFNISPHLGGNMPITQETHRQALITGDNNNYNGKKVPQTHYGNTVDRVATEGYHKKPLADMPAIVQESEHRRQEIQKFSKPRYEPNVNIISHCPDLIQRPKRAPQPYVSTTQERVIYYPDVKPRQNRNTSSKQRPSPAKRVPEQPRPTNNQTQYIQTPAERTSLWNSIENKRVLNQISKIQPKEEPKRSPQDSRQQIPQERWQENDRMTRKQQILQQCYKNSQVSQAIMSGQKPPCPICRERRFTKCCCGR